MKFRKFWTRTAAALISAAVVMSGPAASASSLTPKTTVGITTVAAPQVQDAAFTTAAYIPFTASNFRYNVVQRTGYDPGSRCQAHHTMPQKFEAFFSTRVNIHDPQFGLWWVSTAGVANNHSSMAYQYNLDWENWINSHQNATATTVLQFNTSMKIIYRDYYRC